MKLGCFGVLLLFVLAGCSSMANQDDPISSGSIYLLQKDQIRVLEVKALGGDMGAAHRLLSHYRFSAFDRIKADFWLTKIAESNDPASQYGLAKVG